MWILWRMHCLPVDVLRASTHLPDTVTMNIHPAPSRAYLLCEAARESTLGAQISKETSGAFRGTGMCWKWLSDGDDAIVIERTSFQVWAMFSVCLQPGASPEPPSVLLTWNRANGAEQVAAQAEGVWWVFSFMLSPHWSKWSITVAAWSWVVSPLTGEVLTHPMGFTLTLTPHLK